MGDRANVLILEDGKPGVYLYTHWAGSALPETVAAALKRGEERWGDGAYLARIVFCEMVRGHEDDLSGFGISHAIGDNSRNLLALDSETATVSARTEEDPETAVRSATFAEFVAMNPTQRSDFRG